MEVNSYKDLIFWQKSVDLVIEIYKLVDQFPSSEQFGLVNQMKRCAISIPANIAEGRRCGTAREYHRFLRVAFASGAELETHLIVSKRLGFCGSVSTKKSNDLLEEVMIMLNKTLQSLRPTS